MTALLDEHDELARLCDELEVFADHLPAPTSFGFVTTLRRIERLLPLRHRHARELFESMDASGGPQQAPKLMKRVLAHHLEDEDLLDDLLEAISASPGTSLPANTLGYMLRCFFSGCRRAMLLDEQILHARGSGWFTAREMQRLNARQRDIPSD